MSTRATVHFQRDGVTEAIVYRHSDGYPEGLGTDLIRFFSEVEAQCTNRRFSDPAYLAAKFVVWQAREYAGREYAGRGLLDFRGVGICLEDPGDIEYRYRVICQSQDRPVVICDDLSAPAEG